MPCIAGLRLLLRTSGEFRSFTAWSARRFAQRLRGRCVFTDHRHTQRSSDGNPSRRTMAHLRSARPTSGEPLVAWYHIQAALPSLSASSNNAAFTVALVSNSAQSPIAFRFRLFFERQRKLYRLLARHPIPIANSRQLKAASLSLTTVSGGNPESLTLTASAAPLSGLQLTPSTSNFGSIPLHSTTAPISIHPHKPSLRQQRPQTSSRSPPPAISPFSPHPVVTALSHSNRNRRVHHSNRIHADGARFPQRHSHGRYRRRRRHLVAHWQRHN